MLFITVSMRSMSWINVEYVRCSGIAITLTDWMTWWVNWTHRCGTSVISSMLSLTLRHRSSAICHSRRSIWSRTSVCCTTICCWKVRHCVLLMHHSAVIESLETLSRLGDNLRTEFSLPWSWTKYLDFGLSLKGYCLHFGRHLALILLACYSAVFQPLPCLLVIRCWNT